MNVANNCTLMLGRSRLVEHGVLGAGYSGEVRKVEDENGGVYALKLSNEKTIRFSLADVGAPSKAVMILPEAAEFERLRKLYRAGIPVPRPYAFQIYTNAAGIGSTAILMDLIKGRTLRDWLSEQPGGLPDKTSGRSIHPVYSYADALSRLDVAIAIIKSLLKLKKIAFFADFKPRNIMLREQRTSMEVLYQSYLVDIGGTVLYQDVATNNYLNRDESDTESQSVLYFHPLKDRYLIETTCSYLSPELAFLISEYDFWRLRLNNHYFRTLNEKLISDEQARAASEVHAACLNRNERFGKHSNIDTWLFYNYLQVRKTFRSNGVLREISSLKELLQIEKDNRNTDFNMLSQTILLPPSQNDLVRISEKSNVFTMGLVLTELFGGKRTGLTALSRLKVVNEVFLNEIHNSEFRMVLEWEAANPFLNSSLNFSRSNSMKYSQLASNTIQPIMSLATTSADSYGSNPVDLSSLASFESSSINVSASHIHNDSFFNLYRSHSYPKQGVLSVPNGANLKPADLSIQESVLSILDNSLRTDPRVRPTLNELLEMLFNLRNKIVVQL